jgi:hypothetical protein
MSDAVAVAAPVVPEIAAPAAPPAEAPAVEAKADAPKADAAAVAEAKAEARKFKVKVDGEELEVPEEDLLRDYQTRKASDKRFQEAAAAKKEAAEMRAQVNSVLELMTKDPRAFAEKAKGLGLNPEEFAMAILQPIVEAEVQQARVKEMTPEQRERYDLEQKLAEYERRELERKQVEEKTAKERADAERQANVSKLREQIGTTILEALKTTKLPQSPETAMDLANLLEESMQRGLDVDAKTLAKDLEARRAAELKAVVTPDLIDPEIRKQIRQEALNDPEIREMIRKQAVEEYKKANPLTSSKPVAGPSSRETERKSPKGRTMNSVMRDLMLKKI